LIRIRYLQTIKKGLKPIVYVTSLPQLSRRLPPQEKDIEPARQFEFGGHQWQKIEAVVSVLRGYRVLVISRERCLNVPRQLSAASLAGIEEWRDFE
jgi:hypothetical protein